MNIEQAISSRYSTRAFLPTPVPDADIEAVLDLARQAPSGNNTQPWRVYVVTDSARDAVCEAVLEARETMPRPEREYRSNPSPLPDAYRARSRQSGIALYTLLGIAKGDDDAHHEQQRRNYRFFDAPAGMFFFIDRRAQWGNWLDYGMFLQNIMLAARSRGLHTCPQGAWANFHSVVRAHVGAPDDEMLVCGMAIGYADPRAPVNSLEVPREPVSAFTTWVR